MIRLDIGSIEGFLIGKLWGSLVEGEDIASWIRHVPGSAGVKGREPKRCLC